MAEMWLRKDALGLSEVDVQFTVAEVAYEQLRRTSSGEGGVVEVEAVVVGVPSSNGLVQTKFPVGTIGIFEFRSCEIVGTPEEYEDRVRLHVGQKVRVRMVRQARSPFATDLI